MSTGYGVPLLSTFTRGEKIFELSNHLGNVLVTVSDKKMGVDGNTDGIIDYYTADVVTASDYYPFGFQMPGRKFTQANSNYRYGFNGKEKDNDVNGEGNIYDYGFRIYNPRLGRFLSVDPLSYSYPYYTPYQFAGNMPIAAIDLDGLEQYVVIYYKDQKGGDPYKVEIRTIKSGKVLADQNVQKVIKKSDGISETDGNKIAKNNVLVFEVYNEGTRKEQIEIVDKRRMALTPEETKINNENKKEVGKGDNLFSYPFSDNSKYESQNFDDAKFYSAVKLFSPTKVVTNPESNKPRQYSDNNHNDLIGGGNLILRDVEKIVNDFKSVNPKATDIKANVVFTTTNSNANFVKQIADRLEAKGVKTTIVKDDSYRNAPSSGNTPSKQDFEFSTTVTGVIK